MSRAIVSSNAANRRQRRRGNQQTDALSTLYNLATSPAVRKMVTAAYSYANKKTPPKEAFRPQGLHLKGGRIPGTFNSKVSSRAARYTGNASTFRMRARVHVKDVVGTATTINFVTIPIQPALATSFDSWTAGMARNFDRYRIKKLCYEYIPATATNVSGLVGIGFDPDVLEEDIELPNDFYSLRKYVHGAVYQPLTLDIPIRGGSWYTRTGTVRDSDQKTYDYGQLIIYTNPTTSGIYGSVFADFIIECYDPHPSSCPSASFVSSVAAGANNSPTAPLGDFLDMFGSFPGGYFDPVSFAFNVPGYYVFTMLLTGTGLTSLLITGNGAAIKRAVTVFNASGTKALYTASIKVTGDIGTLIVGVTGTTVTDCRIEVNESSDDQYNHN
jgi:hypothetical protein